MLAAVPKIISFTASNAGSTNPDRFGLAAGDKMEIVYDVATNKGLGSTTNWHQTKEQFGRKALASACCACCGASLTLLPYFLSPATQCSTLTLGHSREHGTLMAGGSQ